MVTCRRHHRHHRHPQLVFIVSIIVKLKKVTITVEMFSVTSMLFVMVAKKDLYRLSGLSVCQPTMPQGKNTKHTNSGLGKDHGIVKMR